MIELVYSLHGDDSSISTHYRHLVDINDINGDLIMKSWPFEGIYHFRVKDGYEDEHLWMDLTHQMHFGKDNNQIEKIRRIEIRVLAIFIPTNDDNNHNNYNDNEYYDIVNNKIGDITFGDSMLYRGDRQLLDFSKPTVLRASSSNESNKKNKKSILSKLGKTLNKKNVKDTAKKTMKAAQSIWKTMSSVAGGVAGVVTDKVNNFIKQSNPSVLSDHSVEILGDLNDMLSVSFEDNNSVHISLLRDIWQALTDIGLQDNNSTSSSSSEVLKFYRKHKLWQIAGCQSDDPIKDLNKAGILTLRSCSYMCRNFPNRSRQMLTNNKAKSKNKYPFLIVAVNITEMLGQILHLRNDKYLSIRAHYWEMFENISSFDEMFVLAFCHLDRLWTQRNAQRSDFGNLINEVKEMMNQVLMRGPKNIDHLWSIAIDEGMAIPNRENQMKN